MEDKSRGLESERRVWNPPEHIIRRLVEWVWSFPTFFAAAAATLPRSLFRIKWWREMRRLFSAVEQLSNCQLFYTWLTIGNLSSFTFFGVKLYIYFFPLSFTLTAIWPSSLSLLCVSDKRLSSFSVSLFHVSINIYFFTCFLICRNEGMGREMCLMIKSIITIAFVYTGRAKHLWVCFQFSSKNVAYCTLFNPPRSLVSCSTSRKRERRERRTLIDFNWN